MSTLDPARKDLAGDAVAHLIAVLTRTREDGGMPPGDLAELRRMYALGSYAPGGALPPPMWRLLTAPAPQAWLESLHPARREEGERALAVVARAVGEAGAPGEQSIGNVLARTGYAEQRFTRLLRATGLTTIANEALAAARWCGVKDAERLSFTARSSFGQFILAAALAEPGRDQQARDRRAHAIARDFYATLNATASPAATPSQSGVAGTEA